MIRNEARDAYIISKKLRSSFRDFSHNNYKNPLNELLFIICSTKSSSNNYERAFKSLKRKFPRFDQLACARKKDIAKAIAIGGLYNNKAAIIKKLIASIKLKFGKFSLSSLKHLKISECEALLISLPGAGKKVARCVMMYSLGHKVFPVDAHCWKISKRLGWVRSNNPYCTSKEMDRLQEKIPLNLRFSLHVNMVSLGKDICTFAAPKCTICPIKNYCRKI